MVVLQHSLLLLAVFHHLLVYAVLDDENGVQESHSVVPLSGLEYFTESPLLLGYRLENADVNVALSDGDVFQ